MVRFCRRESRPVMLSTKPTLDTKGSMTWIFWSGVTMSNCSPSLAKSESANRGVFRLLSLFLES
jgi:hypothetical protein